jgi:hypothetical protein
MNGASEGQEDITQYEVDALKEMRKNWSELREEHERHIDLVRGTLLGLVLGVAGVLFVLYLYPLAGALSEGGSAPDFAGNMVICGASLALIVFAAVILRQQMTRNQGIPGLPEKTVDMIDYAIRRREYSLAQGKKGEPNV